MAENPTDVQTKVQQVDLDIDSWLGAPGAESIIVPENPPADVKPNIFSKGSVDLSFLDKDEPPSDNVVDKDDKEGGVSRGTVEQIINEVNNEEDPDSEEPKRGRPKTDKSGLVEFLKKRIESKEMFAFDDYDENKQSLDDYLGGLAEKDIEELWQANMDNLKNEVASKVPQEFFDNLPDELQFAAKYVMDGGQDLKGLFQALAQVETVRQMDPTDENDQEGIVRSYLLATNFGTDEEVEEEITTWKDLGVLEKKAKQFKPKLNQMQEQIVQQQLAEQEALKTQQQQAERAYMENVFEALRPAEINGLKLDKKTQAQLYSGLVQSQYPSISGRPTTLLGHLLEKYQFVEPNYPLIAEALWLLSNPEDYKNQLRTQGSNQRVQQTVRQLKTEQANRNVSTYQDDDEGTKTRKLNRPTNIFKR